MDIYIYRSDNGITVHGGNSRSFQCRVIVQIPIFPSGSTAQNIIIILFKAKQPAIVAPGKSDHITGQPVVRVYSLIFLLKPDPFDVRSRLFIGLQFLKPSYLLVRHLLGKHIIRRTRMGFQPGTNNPRIQPQLPLHRFQRRFYVFPIPVQHYLRIQNHIIDLFTGCKFCAVAVQNVSPPERNRRAVIGLLGKHLFLISCPVILVNPH